jgi:hypothetical protein
LYESYADLYQVRRLQEENDMLNRTLEQRDMSSRKTSVVIKGVPEMENEVAETTVRDIATSLDVELLSIQIQNGFLLFATKYSTQYSTQISGSARGQHHLNPTINITD